MPPRNGEKRAKRESRGEALAGPDGMEGDGGARGAQICMERGLLLLLRPRNNTIQWERHCVAHPPDTRPHLYCAW